MDKARETLVERRPTNEILAAHLPELLSPEEKLIWLLGDLMNAAENFFGYENPKRLGHINSSAIRILDEIVDPLRADLTRLNAKVEEQAAEIERLKITISAANSAIKMLGGALEKADRDDTARLVEIADLSARLARAVEVMQRVKPALSASFQGGMEEREGGSANRQARYMESVDQLRADARAFLSEQENRDACA